MDALIASSSAGFTDAVGFSLGSAVEWMGENLALVFIGGGVSILYELRYWIVALIALAIVIYFAYRAFRFFRA